MAYLSEFELKKIGFKLLGKNVLVSNKASIYEAYKIEVGDNSRIDDFCLLSGKITIGKNVLITPYCNLAGGEKGIVLEDFTTLAYGVHVFSQSDDYSGKTMTNSTVPKKYKEEIKEQIIIKKHSIIGTGSNIMPGVIIGEGTSVGAMSLVTKSTKEWSLYYGIPARMIKEKSRDLLKLEVKYLEERQK